MAEYISREAIKQVLCGIANGLSVEETKAFKTKGVKALYKIKGAKEILNAIDNDLSFIPATDVQPVKRGRWIETHISLCKWIPEDEKEEGHSFYMAEMKCSCCERYNTVTFALTLNKPDFCQLCGARMIKDGDTDA